MSRAAAYLWYSLSESLNSAASEVLEIFGAGGVLVLFRRGLVHHLEHVIRLRLKRGMKPTAPVTSYELPKVHNV